MNAPDIEPDTRKLFERMFAQLKESLDVATTKALMLEAMLLGGLDVNDTVPEKTQ